MKQETPKAVLALCLGNICRSPIAEGLLRYHIQAHGLNIIVDSAGTSAYHAGEAPDSRSIRVMHQHGHDIGQQRSRQLCQADFERFDLILAMDQSNYRNAIQLAPSPEAKTRVKLLLPNDQEVPDPYYGGVNGFEKVYQMIDIAAAHWVSKWLD